MIFQLLSGSTFTESVFGFLQTLMTGLSMDLLLLVALGIIFIVVVAGSFRVGFSYENRAMRRIRKINKYLIRNPVVTDQNLVEFHHQMKKLPRRIRDRWQLFMLEREGSPSRYLTVEYCVKRSLSNSSTINVMKQVKTFTIVLAFVTFILGLACRLNEAGTVSMVNIIYVFLYATLIPALVCLIGFVFCMILQGRFTSINKTFYDNFTVFVRNVDKATNTMPDYVDYELLFTKQEINEGIPILREYLEKRALEEQRLLEKSKRESVEHSPYNFDDLGVNGSQLIERAVHESESFLMNKMNLQNEIAEYEKQLSQAEKNMDDIEKDANKKLQAIKENLERLDKASAETTNRVEINYNRRQAKDEMDKKAVIEKDLQSMLAKEQTAIDGFNIEIQRRKQEIKSLQDGVESALKSEYNTFATKVYDELSAKVSEENSNLVREYEAQIVQMKAQIKQLSADNEKKDTMLQVKNLELENIRTYGATGNNYVPPVPDNQMSQPDAYNNGAYYGNQENYDANAENLMQNVNGVNDENQTYNQYYDENGNAIDYSQYYGDNQENVDPSQYYDENGNLIDYSQYYDENGNYIGESTQQNEQAPQGSDEQAATEPTENVEQQNEVDNLQTANDVTQSETEQQNADNSNIEQPVENVEQANYDSANETEAQTPIADTSNEVEQEGIDWSQFYDENGNFKEYDGSVDEGASNNDNNNDLPSLPQVDEDGNLIEDDNINTTQPIENNDNENKEEKIIEEFDVNGNVDNVTNEQTTETENEVENKVESDGLFGLNDDLPSLPQVDEDGNLIEDDVKVDEKIGPVVNDESDSDASDDEKDKPDSDEDDEGRKKKQELDEATEKAMKKVAEAEDDAKIAQEKAKKAKEETEDLKKIQEQIAEENKKLMQQQQELRQQIDETLESIEKSNKKADKAKNVAKIKALIEKLKIQAKEAKASGASKEQVKQINASVAELVAAIANYTTTSTSKSKKTKKS